MGLDLSVNIAGIRLKNPVMPASGTFGSGREFADYVDINRLGAVVVKGVSSVPWVGNPSPRIAEVKNGMLNSVGLQNPGIKYFIENDIPFLRQFDTKIIVNVCGHTVQEYAAAAEELSDADIDMLELNISCPNVSEGGIAFGTDSKLAQKVVSEVRKKTKKPLIVKLTPNVTDITEIAKAAEAAGADCVSLINTILGMKIDVVRRRPVLAYKMGGLSGGAIMAIAVRMVYQVAGAVNIPVIGMGGIETGEDAVEFLLAGASAVAVGTASFKNPMAVIQVLEGIESYMRKYGFSNIRQIDMD